MPQFIFSLPREDDIRDSTNGGVMLQIINNDFDEKYTLVTGCPGSGKTTVSIFRLIRLLNSGKEAQLITHQRMLATSIQNILETKDLSYRKARTIHSWFRSTTGQFLGFSSQEERLSADSIKNALGNGFSNMELIIDEGQDLEERIYQSFPEVFGRLTIGADDDQQMYSGDGANENEIKSYLEPNLNHIILQFNYRNTYQIYNFARFFIPEGVAANDPKTLEALRKYKNDGNLPEVFGFGDKDKLLERLKRIIKDNPVGVNIGILVPTTNKVDSYHQQIIDMDFECSKYHSSMSPEEKKDVERDLKNILITTFISAKGMEFDIVIMPEFDSAYSKKQIYVGCTRAKNRLVLMYTGQSLPTMLSGFPENSYDDGKLFGNESESTKEESAPAEDLPF